MGDNKNEQLNSIGSTDSASAPTELIETLIISCADMHCRF